MPIIIKLINAGVNPALIKCYMTIAQKLSESKLKEWVHVLETRYSL
jgi:hypothetical protein